MRLPCPAFAAGLVLAVAVFVIGPTGAGAVDGGAAVRPAATLADCRARVLASNPLLAAALADSVAAAAAARQAGAAPNPELALEVENFGGDLPRWQDAETTWSLTQNLGFLVRRGPAAEAGRRGRDAAAAAVAAIRRDLLAETDRCFHGLLAAQRRVEIHDGIVATADSLRAAVTALVEAGEASPVELARARADRALAAIDRDQAAATVRQARTALAVLWGGVAEGTAAGGELSAHVILPDRARVAAWAGASPEVARLDAEVARLGALARLDRRGRWLDPTAAGGVRRYAATGERTFVASVALPLPLFDRRGGAVGEAEARLAQAGHERRAQADRLVAGRLAAWDELSAAVAAERALRDTVVPEAERVYAAIGEGYRRGKFGLLDALDARRTLAQTRLRHVDALEALQAARIELERLLGARLDAREGEAR